MFCPKCATQNVNGASFCRSCGANISLIPQALSGQLPTPPANEAIERALRRKRWKEPSLAEGSRLLTMGVAFVAVSILIGKYSPGGWHWWYWMLIPAAMFLGRGISDIVRVQQNKNSHTAASQQFPYAAPPQNLPPNTNELRPPVASVTEGTTRLLDHDSTRPYEPLEERKPS